MLNQFLNITKEKHVIITHLLYIRTITVTSVNFFFPPNSSSYPPSLCFLWDIVLETRTSLLWWVFFLQVFLRCPVPCSNPFIAGRVLVMRKVLVMMVTYLKCTRLLFLALLPHKTCFFIHMKDKLTVAISGFWLK